jgi:hypothetical protein
MQDDNRIGFFIHILPVNIVTNSDYLSRDTLYHQTFISHKSLQTETHSNFIHDIGS